MWILNKTSCFCYAFYLDWNLIFRSKTSVLDDKLLISKMYLVIDFVLSSSDTAWSCLTQFLSYNKDKENMNFE